MIKIEQKDWARAAQTVDATTATSTAREGSFKCPHCDTSFRSKHGALKHQRVHDGLRPWTCKHSSCGKTFSHKSNLTRHERIHKGLRNYVCEDCGRAFFTSSNLKQHMIIHTDRAARDWHCPYEDCDATYRYQASLRKHVMAKHQQKAPAEPAVEEPQGVEEEEDQKFFSIGSPEPLDLFLDMVSPHKYLILSVGLRRSRVATRLGEPSRGQHACIAAPRAQPSRRERGGRSPGRL